MRNFQYGFLKNNKCDCCLHFAAGDFTQYFLPCQFQWLKVGSSTQNKAQLLCDKQQAKVTTHIIRIQSKLKEDYHHKWVSNLKLIL